MHTTMARRGLCVSVALDHHLPRLLLPPSLSLFVHTPSRLYSTIIDKQDGAFPPIPRPSKAQSPIYDAFKRDVESVSKPSRPIPTPPPPFSSLLKKKDELKRTPNNDEIRKEFNEKYPNVNIDVMIRTPPKDPNTVMQKLIELGAVVTDPTEVRTMLKQAVVDADKYQPIAAITDEIEYEAKLEAQLKRLAPEAMGLASKEEKAAALNQAHYLRMKAECEEYLKANETDNAYEILVSMRRFGLVPAKTFFEAVLHNFAKNKMTLKVREVLAFMERDGIPPDEVTHMTVVRAYGKIRQFEWVKKAFIRMCEKVQPSVRSYYEVIQFFSRDPHIANVRKAEEVFYTAHRHDVRPDTKTCYLFMRHLVETHYEGDVDRAIEVLKFMKVKNIPQHPSTVTVFRRHLFTLVEPNQLIRMKKVLRGLQHGGFNDKSFAYFWNLVKAKKWIHHIQRADLAPP